MNLLSAIIFLGSVLVYTSCQVFDHGHDGFIDSNEYANEWVVHLDDEDVTTARTFALKKDYEFLGEISGFPGYFLMRKTNHPVLSDRDGFAHTLSLQGEQEVVWAQQLFRKTRVKRGYLPMGDLVRDSDRILRGWPIALNVPKDWQRKVMPRKSLNDGEDGTRGIPDYLLELWKKEESRQKSRAQPEESLESDGSLEMFNDQQWKDQWYMNDRQSRSLGEPVADLHLVQVYREFQLTGKGIRVVVLDDGLEYTHSDIRDNYDPTISYDYNNGTFGDPDPFPNHNRGYPNSHGTRCAGEIAMQANNHICGVGVAYEASIGAIRMLDGVINDRIEGLAMQHAIDKVDIFSASWGPSDDGKTVEGPGRLAQTAIWNGVTQGRNGRGVIYVWANGNGGMSDDSCGCDGYTSSIYTVSIGSTSQKGNFPWYGERCASTMATTFSSGDKDEKQVATIDNNNECTEGHSGTSAAAPLATGIIALVLQQNPLLTWRDVQHLLVWSTSTEPVKNLGGWFINGIGLNYNHRCGFGVMDAYKMVTMAKDWKNVGSKTTCWIRPEKVENSLMSNQLPAVASFSTEKCQLDSDTTINYLEHVEVVVNIKYPKRGQLEVVLESPSGTMSQLLTIRSKDVSSEGFTNWKFSSVHFWGEIAKGEWKLYVVDRVNLIDADQEPMGDVGPFSLVLHGTKEMSDAQRDIKNQKRALGNENIAKADLMPVEKLFWFLSEESPLNETAFFKKTTN